MNSLPGTGVSTFSGNPSFSTSASNCAGVPIHGCAPLIRTCCGTIVLRLGCPSSGLAKAFFYAGTRALLVSHWSGNSEAAVAINTTMLTEMADNPEIGRAEALRRSMLAMMANEEKDYFAHHMFWAPFVVVSEGGMPK